MLDRVLTGSQGNGMGMDLPLFEEEDNLLNVNILVKTICMLYPI